MTNTKAPAQIWQYTKTSGWQRVTNQLTDNDKVAALYPRASALGGTPAKGFVVQARGGGERGYLVAMKIGGSDELILAPSLPDLVALTNEMAVLLRAAGPAM